MIYIPSGQNLEIPPKPQLARVLLYRLGSPDRPLIASDLPPLVSAAVNEIQPRRCRRSELITELGYEFESLCCSYL